MRLDNERSVKSNQFKNWSDASHTKIKKKKDLAQIMFMQIGVLFSSLYIKTEYMWAWALEGCRLKTDLAVLLEFKLLEDILFLKSYCLQI